MIQVYINGFEWFLDVDQEPKRLYPTNNKNEHVGYSIYSNHFTQNEREQIFKRLKHGTTNNETSDV